MLMNQIMAIKGTEQALAIEELASISMTGWSLMRSAHLVSARSRRATSLVEDIVSSSPAPPENSGDLLLARFRSCCRRCVMRRRLWKVVIVLLWIALQACLFAHKYQAIMTSTQLKTVRGVLGHTLAISRASAIVINFNSSIILFCCCRVTLTWMRGFKLVSWIGLPIDDSISLHKLAGYSIGLFSLAHTVGHYFNFVKSARHSQQNVWLLLFLNNSGLSGHILLLIMVALLVTAGLQVVRSKKYEVFYYAHKLFYLYFALISVHGAFCFIKTDNAAKPCIPPQSWIWIAPGLAVYLAELLYRMLRSRRFTYVSKVILHQSSVFELQIRKPSFSFMPGQYILLNIPSVSRYQWHPFTVTSAPEDQFVSVHIRAVGNWTHGAAAAFGIRPDPRTLKFGALIETPLVMPKVFIDGPYGAPCQDFSRHEVVVCIGAGIGQTPFSSVLRSIWYNVVHPSEEVTLKKIIYIGVCRNVSVILPYTLCANVCRLSSGFMTF